MKLDVIIYSNRKELNEMFDLYSIAHAPFCSWLAGTGRHGLKFVSCAIWLFETSSIYIYIYIYIYMKAYYVRGVIYYESERSKFRSYNHT